MKNRTVRSAVCSALGLAVVALSGSGRALAEDKAGPAEAAPRAGGDAAAPPPPAAAFGDRAHQRDRGDAAPGRDQRRRRPGDRAQQGERVEADPDHPEPLLRRQQRADGRLREQHQRGDLPGRVGAGRPRACASAARATAARTSTTASAWTRCSRSCARAGWTSPLTAASTSCSTRSSSACALGVKGKAGIGPLAIVFDPSLNIGLIKRYENKEFLQVPVRVGFMATSQLNVGVSVGAERAARRLRGQLSDPAGRRRHVRDQRRGGRARAVRVRQPGAARTAARTSARCPIGAAYHM